MSRAISAGGTGTRGRSLPLTLSLFLHQAFVDAWKAACATGGTTYLNVPAGKSYQIWPVTLAGPCRGEIKLMVFSFFLLHLPRQS